MLFRRAEMRVALRPNRFVDPLTSSLVVGNENCWATKEVLTWVANKLFRVRSLKVVALDELFACQGLA